MPNYNKMKVAELDALLSRRGLDTGGTKVQMMSRLVKQDAEEEAAEKATAAAINAASTATAAAPAAGSSPNNTKGTLSSKGSGADAKEKSKSLRNERRRKSSGKSKVKGLEESYVQVDGEGMKDMDDEVDDETYIKQLMLSGTTCHKHTAAPSTSSGIVVNMTPSTPRGRRRTRWEPGPSSVTPKHNTKHSNALALQLPLSPSKIPLPEDNDNELNKSSRKRNGKDGACAEQHDSATAFKVILLSLLFSMAFIFIVKPGIARELASYIFALLCDPVGSIKESIWGPATVA
ncbi:hypothetical protein N0V90_004555 [Kalmusia sp. IMI 367209]|nr:hypothetical protein N0V90_004555 [Kalmusia sp. IMI 367209]